MSTRSPIGRPVVGRPRHSRTTGSREEHIANNNNINNNNAAHGDRNQHGSRHGKHGAPPPVPKVPRIPDRFLLLKDEEEGYEQPKPKPGNATQKPPIKDSADSADEKNTADDDNDDVKNKLIPLVPALAPHTRYLPNCSFGRPKEVQVVSNAMMQAYIAMRGNCLGGEEGNDPLFEWIRQREELARDYDPKKIQDKRHVSRMLFLIDKALESSNMGGDSPRDCVFEVYRPDFEHIRPPQDMDMSANEFAACCADFEWGGDDDDDDEEADVPSGRISPCTFLEWSKDCVRWNGEVNENKKDTTSYIRMRPVGPAPPRGHRHGDNHNHRHDHRQAHGHQHGHNHEREPIPPDENLEPQWDVNTGEELTPTYYVPTSPSIIYTPPGVEFAGFRTASFHAQYRRMAPLVDRELRARIYGVVYGGGGDGGGGGGGFPHLPDSERDRFSLSEIEAATTTIPELAHRAGAEVAATLQAQWAMVSQAEAAERALRAQAEEQRARISALRADGRRLAAFVPALAVRRDMREARARRRADLVRAYVADHALDARGRLDMAAFRLEGARADVARNAARIAALEDEVRALCVSGGVRDAQHAFAVLMGEEDAEGDGEGSCGPGAGGGGGGGSTGAGGAGEDLNVGGVGHDHHTHGYGFDGHVHGLVPGHEHGYGNGNGYPGAVAGVDGHGHENAAPLGPWSASSLGRAEEEYDRFVADMHMQGGRSRAGSNKEWERRSASSDNDDKNDDESHDSGVAGVRNRSPFQGPDGMWYLA
ncbi:hypothetical protein F5Y14DRAFT_464629 [Nemania sp. NC0429]|nr:hypothetical protein F5Y14DRAFT_464629 [Nemania sp. NC0429]